MNHTNIFATPDELHTLKEAAKVPYIMLGGIEPPNVQAMCHDMALKHDLPEIPGFYGLDLETGEFLVSDGDMPQDDHPIDMSNPCQHSCQGSCENSYQAERIVENEAREKVLAEKVYPATLEGALEKLDDLKGTLGPFDERFQHAAFGVLRAWEKEKKE